jgi:uncharacterized protein (TIGR03435 family)
MKIAFSKALLLPFIGWLGCAQSGEAPPKFEIAGVRSVPYATRQYFQTSPVRNGRYEVKTATLVDLIRTAYDIDADKITGGPSWLEMNRYSIVAKVPSGARQDDLKPMLQTLLAERFKLAVHRDTRDLPAYALSAGKKPQLKESDGSGSTGCKLQSAPGAPTEGGVRVMFSDGPGGNSAPITLNLGSSMLVQYVCRNMGMEEFASGMRSMLGVGLGQYAVLNRTGIQGKWNFDFQFSLQLNTSLPAGSEGRIGFPEALDKQLGLKLEQIPTPTPVLIVDRAEASPTPDPPGVAEALPPIPVPTSFEVASVKPTDPTSTSGVMRTQAGGRVIVQGMPLAFLLSQAFGTNTNSTDQLIGAPEWARTARFDINAKAQTDDAQASIASDAVGPLLRSLLVDRFGLKYHSEERVVNSYALTASKPKMKKADPSSRTSCKNVSTLAGAPPPPGSQVVACQNITMDQFAARLQGMTSELTWPVANSTGIEGGWDFTLVYSTMSPTTLSALSRAASTAQPAADMPSAQDPSGSLTLFEAVEKQLGLKLEPQKRTEHVTVIDHIEQKPTEN